MCITCTQHQHCSSTSGKFPPQHQQICQGRIHLHIYDKDEVNFYNARTTKITVLEEAILTGWQCPHQKMWRIPLIPIVTDLNMDTLLLDHPSGLDSLNAMYAVSSSTVACNHVVLHLGKLAQRDHIHNVYELPSVKPTI